MIVQQGVEENFGGEFSVFIELSEIGFDITFVMIIVQT